MPDLTFELQILSPEQVILDEEVTAVSLKNEVGKFDILPQHTNFISPVQEDIIVWNGRQRRQINIDQGIVHVKNNKVRIFTGLPNAEKESTPEHSETLPSGQMKSKQKK